MAAVPRPRVVLIASVITIGWIVSSCSQTSSSDANAVGTSGMPPAFAALQMTPFDVTVENHAAEPIIDVELAIKPVGSPILFTTRVPRLASGEKRVLPTSDFMSRDGTPFSVRVARPKEVRVTAVDISGGKKFDMTTPWKQ